MQEERLLRRIIAWEKDPHRRTREDPKRIIDSVREHLQRILNTRQGSAMIGEDYGLPDFAELLRDYPDSLRDFERSIRMTIQKYEPRLKMVRVKLLPNEEDLLTLRFQVSARLAAQEQRVPVLLESTVDQDGKVNITY
jgi:type VI secretion system protein